VFDVLQDVSDLLVHLTDGVVIAGYVFTDGWVVGVVGG